ncbi:MAG: ABC transporter ATP-binding protein [Chloroflexi bacterium]|nr:ABC transporter ATP-binding protein [Chloroflexota bacterium]
MDNLIEIRDLTVSYSTAPNSVVHALNGISFDLARGEVLGIVGETGSGKTTLALTLMGLATTAQLHGQVLYENAPLPLGDDNAMRAMRWRRIALAFQGSSNAFDPVYTMEHQVIEPIIEHLKLDQRTARERARALWDNVGLTPELFERYPHQLSGGEKQRAMLAMALACDPELLIVDEPTSGLDMLTRGRILELLAELRRQRGLTMIVISHDLDDVAGLTDRTLVLYAGQIAELGKTANVLDVPLHPYTWGLVNAYPRMDRAKDLWGIRGQPPDPMNLPRGCPFHPRCTQAIERCAIELPRLAPSDGRLVACHLGGLQTLLEVRGITKRFRDGPVAVKNVWLSVREGEVVALVGQTGSGKTTLAKCLVGLHEPDAGQVIFEGQDVHALRDQSLRAARRRIQMIFQDPFESLSPRLTVLELVREPLDIQQLGAREERDQRARRALADVRLPATPAFLSKHGHELSGGQLQRVAIARALILEPKLIIADEPVAMLDASEQAKVLRLLKEAQNERGMGLLLISHDLALVRKVSDRIAVMRQGEIVEVGLSHSIIQRPEQAYTQTLIAAAQR